MLLKGEAMKRKSKKKQKKTLRKKKKSKAARKRNSQSNAIDLQKVVSFKFQTLGKVYENFKKKRKIEKVREEKLKSKRRVSQGKKEQYWI